VCGDVDFGEKPANIKRLKPINTTNKHYYRILFSLAMLVQNSILTHRNLETYSENLLPGFCLGTKICLENRVGGIGNREQKEVFSYLVVPKPGVKGCLEKGLKGS
jgi:hypothetical protein